MAAAPAGAEAVQTALQAVAHGTGWTYSILWRLCPHQGALVWAEGHYNGAIKTRKTTVMSASGGEEEEEVTAARRRSRQLRELYDSLAGEQAARADDGSDGGGGSKEKDAAPPVMVVVARRRPGAAALAPEDLTETEWFYLMSASYSFPPRLGLPGEAFARRGHVWLCGANKVDSEVFSRAILARTVVCIPVNDDGVLEIGTIEKVQEDIGLVQHARSIFMDQQGIPIMPTLSGHSTSKPSTQINHQTFQVKTKIYIGGSKVQPNNLNREEEHIETEDGSDRIDSETNTENDSCPLLPQYNVGNEHYGRSNNARSSGLIETLGSIRDGCRNHVDEVIPMLMICQNAQDHQAVLAESAHYIKTVLTILRHNACRRVACNTKTYLTHSKNSSFSRWNPKRTSDLERDRMLISEGTPQAQRMLKSILFISAPSCSSHQRHRAEVQPPEPSKDVDVEGTDRGRARRRQTQPEQSTSHVVKERQRREKLNERFIILRSLVPFVTKMDRASILGDTIEYVKQLRRRVHDLEMHAPVSKEKRAQGHSITSSAAMAAEVRSSNKMRAIEASSSCSTTGGVTAASTEVKVSIIESDALLDLRCPHRDGLLLRVMQALHRELGMEVTSVHASSAGDVLLVELRAKVKEMHGRRSRINEVKRTIHQILSSY